MLQRRLLAGSASTAESEQESDGGGEAMSLDMQLTESPDGGLTVTTAGTRQVPENPEGSHQVSRRLARDEENILRHRDPEDLGYSDYDQYYEDREPEL